MELFAEIVNGFKPLTIFARKLRLRCLIGSSYASDLGISLTCIFIDYPAHLLDCVCISNINMIVCVHYSFLIWFSPMISILHLTVLPEVS